jgi:hypothetical protein
MNEQIFSNHLKDFVKDFYLPGDEQIEELRRIIRKESGHKFTYEETRDVAYQLIRLYECLAGDTKIVPEELRDGLL